MQKNSITNKITPCCGLPFSVIYWWVSNLTLNSESDRQYLLTQISQSGVLSIDGWKVLINSATLEADASFTKETLLSWFDCGRQPSCEQLKLIIEGLAVGGWTPEGMQNIINYNYNMEDVVPSEALYNDTPETLAGDVLKRVDKITGEDVNYRKTTVWKDGTTMNDAKADGVIYIKKGVDFYRREFQFLNIKWFGVKGDGVTDDTVAIQKAIDFQKNNGNGWSGNIASQKIFFPSGIYIVSDSLNIYNSLLIEGESKSSVIIEMADNAKNIFNYSEVQTYVNNSVAIKNLTLRYKTRGNGVALNLSVTSVAGALTPTVTDVVCVNCGVGFRMRVNIHPTLRGCYAINCGRGFDFGDVGENGSFNFGAVLIGCYASVGDVGFYGYLESSTFIGCSGDSNRIGWDVSLVSCLLNISSEGNTESSLQLKQSYRNTITVNSIMNANGGNGILLLEGSSNNSISGQIYSSVNNGTAVQSTGLDLGSFIKPATGNIFKHVDIAGFAVQYDDINKYSIIENGRQKLEKGNQQILWFKLDEILANEIKHGETTIANTTTYSFGGGRYVGMIISKEQNAYFPATGTLTIEPIATVNEGDLEYIGVMPNSHSVVFTPANVSQKAFVTNPDLAIIGANQSLGVRITASADYLSEYMKKIKIGLIVEI